MFSESISNRRGLRFFGILIGLHLLVIVAADLHERREQRRLTATLNWPTLGPGADRGERVRDLAREVRAKVRALPSDALDVGGGPL